MFSRRRHRRDAGATGLIATWDYLTSKSSFTGIITVSLLAGATLAQEPFGSLPVPAFEDHRAAAGTDAQDGGGALAPGRVSVVSQTQFLPETLPPLLDQSR